ncbi:DNA-dependent metalloprotease WSS1-like [Bidens hawaiensis]|uniref:DNA-dependent metalloprotease WSS1-like n=1 Tax=Bidens hawaiensis TaxID=980011 RepID=UPI00404B43A5
MSNIGDLHKVWEIRTLKKKVGGDEARKFLEKIAKQVQPIMRKHKWRVNVLSEMCPKNPRLLGLNVGHGLHVKLRLRRPNTDWDFYPFHEVLDTMLHELCHNAIGPHNVSFYKLWDDLRKECEELISKGISGSGDGFDMPGKRLGGNSRQPPLSSLRKTALAAAENRARQGSLMLPGPNRLGGDKSIMSALTPAQAAAMAAERRYQDDLWCGLEEIVDEEENCNHGGPQDNNTVQILKPSVTNPKSQKRIHQESHFVDLTDAPSVSTSAAASGMLANKKCRQTGSFIDLTSGASTSGSSSDQKTGCDTESNGWECVMCTLLNSVLAPICELCGTHKPKEAEEKYKIWSCKYCTLENSVKLEKCGACGQWRYSYGQPIATPSPNVGT